MSTRKLQQPLLIVAVGTYEIKDGNIHITSKGAVPLDHVQFSTWMSENQPKFLAQYKANPFWRERVIELEVGSEIKLYHLLRRLSDIGYEKELGVSGPGQMSHQGNLIEIWPINSSVPYRISFDGNHVESISQLEREADTDAIRALLKREQKLVLFPGDYVVHVDHGIGKYSKKIERDGDVFHVLEYAKRDTLMVPVGVEHKLSAYVGFEKPSIHRLGGTVWFKTRKKAKEDIYKFAKQLLDLYAKRSVSERSHYEYDRDMMSQFEDKFEHDLTPDQLSAWDEIRTDMNSDKPMDRLLCGDVGFGKTEVALRAIALAVFSGKQVAFVAPTTPLAWQHFHTLQDRFKDLPVNIQLFSRVVSSKKVKDQVEELKSGKIDIAIGTHRLLSKDIHFKSLGIIVIDEEQKFGVKQKENFFDKHPGVDFLTISATPIPRTLNLALAGVRDISLIMSPPLDRQSIETHVEEFGNSKAYKAVRQELKRGGQVYWLHNFVQTIYARQAKLLEEFKDIEVAVIHGQMPESQIVRTLDDFERGKIQILIATSIIENGLDFPEANTLIVEDATRLGLSQAHQIRGRIGRSDKKAVAWFFYKRSSLTEQGEERLGTLKTLTGLGDGYNIAAKDLEIRGAGNILGKEQSGTINRVGLNLYYQMLNQAVEELKS